MVKHSINVLSHLKLTGMVDSGSRSTCYDSISDVPHIVVISSYSMCSKQTV